ncbi:telomeric repeat-binding factor 2-interacting protein 1 [Dromiciops gliroides]|uniref:telomeric repeat-binding factor 2-interacting protein 1 n=1 Tax=Dromiciops gliroides TaxID=33562 RepID=UPI001CC7F905|nr:telomeric repeat-binding factor 2-interacting protein 1 [Dromiciops gliroides]
MAEGLEMGKDPNDPTHSRSLFVREDGSSMSFYVRPSPVKRRLSTYILHGGGTLCRVQEPEAVLLAPPGEAQAEASGDFISTQYITDCVERNERLDLEDYRLGRPPAQRELESPEASPGEPEEVSGEPEEAYTEAEDQAIVRYVRDNAHSPSTLAGTNLWKALEKAALMQRPWQSMKDRYLKYLKGLEHRLLEEDEPSGPSLKLKRKAEETEPADSEPQKKKAPDLPEEDSTEEQVQESKTPEEDVLCPENQEVEDSEVQNPDLELPVVKNGELAGPGKNNSNLKEAPKDSEVVQDSVVLETQLEAEESSLSPSLSPEVGEAIRVIKHLMEEFSVDLATVTQAFLKNSGELEATCSFLQTGQRSDGYPVWTRQDDVDLQKDDENTRSKLIKKFGAKNVARRIEFRRN